MQSVANIHFGHERISEYIHWAKTESNEYPNIFVGLTMGRTNIRIYSVGKN